MANPFHGENSQQNRSGGAGYKTPAATKRQDGALKLGGPNWPKVPGKTGPKRNTTGAPRCPQYPSSKGL